ncbi:MAG: cob(I)yrinic acid a,c-diamide adenosyltransferase [Pseudomonadota bacterium]
MPELKIYTKAGDRGLTSLLGGERVSKDDPRVMAYGALDELQAHLGLARSMISLQPLTDIILSIQRDVTTACAELASAPEALPRLTRRLGEADAARLERWIDELVDVYGLPGHFVLPGRNAPAAAMHLARTVCRRGERHLVFLARPLAELDELLRYFNRLSDLLFVMAWSLEVQAAVEDVLADLTGTREREARHEHSLSRG